MQAGAVLTATYRLFQQTADSPLLRFCAQGLQAPALPACDCRIRSPVRAGCG